MSSAGWDVIVSARFTDRARWLRLVLCGLVMTVAALLGGAGLAGAVASAPLAQAPLVVAGGWHHVPLGANAAHAYLYSVSCGSPVHCVAVGQVDHASSAAAWVRSPSGWRRDDPIVDATTAGLLSVSCPSADWCAAVGRTGDRSVSNPKFLAMQSVNGEWQSMPIAPIEPTPSSLNVTGISCPRPTLCVAVARAEVNGSDGHRVIMRWNGTVWTQVDTDIVDAADVRSVSCPSVRVCWAVGDEVIERWDLRRGTLVSTVSAAAPPGFLNSVSCVTGDACMAVGWTFSQATHGNPPKS
jgi:hypothetical protein